MSNRWDKAIRELANPVRPYVSEDEFSKYVSHLTARLVPLLDAFARAEKFIGSPCEIELPPYVPREEGGNWFRQECNKVKAEMQKELSKWLTK